MPAGPLAVWELEEIRVGIERFEPFADTVQRLGCYLSMVSEEVRCNDGRSGYRLCPRGPTRTPSVPASKQMMLVADPVLSAHVEARLRSKDSPMTIAIRLVRGTHGVTAQVSH